MEDDGLLTNHPNGSRARTSARLREEYGASLPDNLRDCHDCAAAPGEVHRDGCDVERCSVCGHQRIGCCCRGHDKAFARWTGLWPGSAEAYVLGLDLNTLMDSAYRYFFVKPVNGKIPPEF